MIVQFTKAMAARLNAQLHDPESAAGKARFFGDGEYVDPATSDYAEIYNCPVFNRLRLSHVNSSLDNASLELHELMRGTAGAGDLHNIVRATTFKILFAPFNGDMTSITRLYQSRTQQSLWTAKSINPKELGEVLREFDLGTGPLVRERREWLNREARRQAEK